MNIENTKELKFQKSEIGNMEWMPYEKCMEKIRDYNIEKKELISSLNNLLLTSIIY